MKKIVVLILAVILFFLTKNSGGMNPYLYIAAFIADAGLFIYFGYLVFRK